MNENRDLFMKRDEHLSNIFDSIAEEYDMYRYEYPKDLFETIWKSVSDGKNALEIGIGTGKATKPFLEKGYYVTAIDPNKNMLDLSRKKYEKSNIEFCQTSFEEYYNGKKFDLIYAASSFHWVKDAQRVSKVYDMLNEMGTFARIKNTTFIDFRKHSNNSNIISVYEHFLPGFLPVDRSPQRMKNEEYYEVGFREVDRSNFYSDHNILVEDYIKLINTYTEYLDLDKDIRFDFEKALMSLNDNSFVLTQKSSLFIAIK